LKKGGSYGSRLFLLEENGEINFIPLNLPREKRQTFLLKIGINKELLFLP